MQVSILVNISLLDLLNLHSCKKRQSNNDKSKIHIFSVFSEKSLNSWFSTKFNGTFVTPTSKASFPVINLYLAD